MNKNEQELVKNILRKIKHGVILLALKVLVLFPKNRVVFIAFGGKQYSDNSKAVSDELYRSHKDIKQVWLFQEPDKFKDVLPKNIKCAKYSWYKLLYYVATSKIIVDNDVFSYLPGNKIIRPKHQLIIETWHGDRGFKKCFLASNNEKYNFKFTSELGKIDYFVTGSEFAEMTSKEMFNYNGNFLKIGCPRNDVFFRDNTEDYKQFRKNLNINEDTKILLYAPTYRTYTNKNIESIDFERLVKALEDKTKKEWIVIYRSHHGSEHSQLKKVVNGNTFKDMAEILPYVDMLITDFSSCAGDFILSGKPVILYLEDYNEFEKEDKGFFFNIKESPYLQATNNKELESIIKNTSEKEYSDVDKKVLEFYGSYEDGHATEKLCEKIYKFYKGEK